MLCHNSAQRLAETCHTNMESSPCAQISREEAAHAEAAKELEAGANSRGMAEEACTEEEGKAALEQVRAKAHGSGGGEDQVAKRCSTKVRSRCALS